MLGLSVRIVFATFVIVTTGCSRFGEQPGEVFARFRSALDAQNIDLIRQEVSSGTKAYLRRLEPWVYEGEVDELLSLRPFDLFLVLRIRMLREAWNEDAWKIAKQGSSSLGEEFIHPLWLPMFVDDFVGETIDRVDFYEGIAGGHLYVNGRKLKLRLRFEKEGSWKVDIVSYFRDSFNRELEKFLGEEFRNRNLVDELMKSKYGELYSKDLYLERISED